MVDVFVLCRECQVVHRISDAYRLGAGGALAEEAVIAYGQFLVQHRHHPLERLHRHSLTEHHVGALADPTRHHYLELTNGDDVFTIRRTRDTIDLPPIHEVVDLKIDEDPVHLSVEETALRRALDRHFYPYSLRPTKIDQFVRAVHDVLATLEGDAIEPAFDDGEDPAVSIAPLPDDSCVDILARCLEVFDPWELGRVATFVTTNRDEYGALALRVRRDSTLRPL